MNLKKTKMISKLLLGVFTVFMLVMALTVNPFWGYMAIGMIVVYGFFVLIFWRCPKCGKNLGPLWVKCCPNCGENLDL